MPQKKRGSDLQTWKTNRPEAKPGKLRIVGGRFRGRQLAYSGDPRTRPMKDNTREAVFNLAGGYLPGKHVFDLFCIAIFDVGVEETSMYDGGEEAPF